LLVELYDLLMILTRVGDLLFQLFPLMLTRQMEHEPRETQDKGEEHSAGRHVSPGLARRIPAEQFVNRGAKAAAFAMRPSQRPHGPRQQQQQERGQWHQRGVNVKHARMFAEVEHNYPFNSSAVSTSTVM